VCFAGQNHAAVSPNAEPGRKAPVVLAQALGGNPRSGIARGTRLASIPDFLRCMRPSGPVRFVQENFWTVVPPPRTPGTHRS